MRTPITVPRFEYRTIVQSALTIGGVVLLFALLVSARTALVTFFVAVVISTAMRPVIDRLSNWGIEPALSILMLYLILGVVGGISFYLFGTLILEQVQQVWEQVPGFYTMLREMLLESEHFAVLRIGLSMPETLPFAQMSDTPSETTPLLFIESVGRVTRFIFFLTATLSLAFHWSIQGENVKRALLLLISMNKRDEVRELLREIEEKLGSFVVGQIILVVVIGLAALVAYLVIGLPYALTLAVFAGLMELVPIIGPILGAVPALIVAIGISPFHALLVLGVSALIQSAENNLIVPRVMDHAVGVNPLVTLLAFAAFSALFGLVGAIVSIPLAAVLQILLNRYVLEASDDQSQIEGRGEWSALRYHAQELIQDIRRFPIDEEQGLTEEIEEQLEAIAVDLDSLLAHKGQA